MTCFKHCLHSSLEFGHNLRWWTHERLSSGDLVVKRRHWASQEKNAADRGGGLPEDLSPREHAGDFCASLQSYDVNSCRVQRWQVRPLECSFKLRNSILVRSLVQDDKSRAMQIKRCCCFQCSHHQLHNWYCGAARKCRNPTNRNL